MENKEKEIKIDGSKVLVVYASPSYQRESRVTVTDNLGKGKPTYHVAGYSYQRDVSFEILLKHNSKMIGYLDDKSYKNEIIKITSTFKNIPSAKYYIKSFTLDYHDKDYMIAKLDLILYDGSSVTEFIGKKKKKSVKEAISSDKKSPSKVASHKKIRIGESDKYTVKLIQKALRRDGFYGKNLKIDGVYGKDTKKAVQKFQKAKGLKVTGIIDKNTVKKLNL